MPKTDSINANREIFVKEVGFELGIFSNGRELIWYCQIDKNEYVISHDSVDALLIELSKCNPNIVHSVLRHGIHLINPKDTIIELAKTQGTISDGDVKVLGDGLISVHSQDWDGSILKYYGWLIEFNGNYAFGHSYKCSFLK